MILHVLPYAMVALLIGGLATGAAIQRRTQIVARLDSIDMEPADSPDEVEIGTWDHHTETALEVFATTQPCRQCIRDADAEQWAETERRLTPDHGYGPAPQGPGMAIHPRRTA